MDMYAGEVKKETPALLLELERLDKCQQELRGAISELDARLGPVTRAGSPAVPPANLALPNQVPCSPVVDMIRTKIYETEEHTRRISDILRRLDL